MDTEKIMEIIQTLDQISMSKARKLLNLLNEYVFESPSKEEKEQKSKEIRNFLYRIFLKSMDRHTRNKFINTSVCINEFSYQIEGKEWVVAYDGVYKYDINENDDMEKSLEIKRTHSEGFIPVTDDKETRKYYRDNNVVLTEISRHMDYVEEVVDHIDMYAKPNISFTLLNQIIEALDLPRTKKENKKSY